MKILIIILFITFFLFNILVVNAFVQGKKECINTKLSIVAFFTPLLLANVVFILITYFLFKSLI